MVETARGTPLAISVALEDSSLKELGILGFQGCFHDSNDINTNLSIPVVFVVRLMREQSRVFNSVSVILTIILREFSNIESKSTTNSLCSLCKQTNARTKVSRACNGVSVIAVI